MLAISLSGSMPLINSESSASKLPERTDAALYEIPLHASNPNTVVPDRSQAILLWFHARTAKALAKQGMQTLGDLVDLINTRGASWWRSVPHIGPCRADVILRFLQAWRHQLGEIALEKQYPKPVEDFDLLPILDALKKRGAETMETFELPVWLSSGKGANRSSMSCFISARNDLEAINSYLNRYKDQNHTLRAYRKELERFILWCAFVARKPMSSLLVDDCEAYKHFLHAPLPEFCGARTSKTSQRWRPFSNKAMSAASQKQALLVVRSAFEWFVKVRYLAGNPWVAVRDPVVVEQVDGMRIDRALTRSVWNMVVEVLTQRAAAAENFQDRVALAAMLLMGDSGLRRAEAVNARRSNVTPSRYASDVWMLVVLGKRNKVRKVPVSQRTIEALRNHWRDRKLEFDVQLDDVPLLAPVVVPGTQAAKIRHAVGTANGYDANSVYHLVISALRRVRDHAVVASAARNHLFTPEEVIQLEKTSPHAFRHTFGTLAVEDSMPITVVQDVLGHASPSTTAIYVKAKERWIAETAQRYFKSISASVESKW